MAENPHDQGQGQGSNSSPGSDQDRGSDGDVEHGDPPYVSMANYPPPDLLFAQDILTIRQNVEFMNAIARTISANLAALGTTLFGHLETQQIDNRNNTQTIVYQLSAMEVQNNSHQDEIRRLGNVTEERLAQIRLSTDRHMGNIEHNQGLIEQNTHATYRVLTILAWKQIVFSYFTYQLRWVLEKSFLWYRTIFGVIYYLVRAWIRWDVEKLQWLARPGRILGNRWTRPYMVWLINHLRSFALVERPLVVDRISWLLLAAIGLSLNMLGGISVGSSIASIDTASWAAEYTGLHGTAYANPAIYARQEPSSGSFGGREPCAAHLSQTYDSSQVSAAANVPIVAADATLHAEVSYLKESIKMNPSIKDKIGIWDKYIKPIIARKQSEPGLENASDDGEAKGNPGLQEVLKMAIDAAEDVATTVAMTVRISEAKFQATKEAGVTSEDAEKVTATAMARVKKLRGLIDQFTTMVDKYATEEAK